jgi:hypothetical protein
MEPVLCPTKIRVVRNHQNSSDFRTIFGVAPPFWFDGPCIQLESIRDVSYDSVMTLDPLYSVATIILCGFCLD